MNWTNLAKALKEQTRIECDVIPVGTEYALLLASASFAIAIPGLKYNMVPKAIKPLVHSCNLGEAKKVFEKQDKIERPYSLESTYISYHSGASDNKRDFLFLEGVRDNSPERRPFFIKEKYYNMIPGDVISLHAPDAYGGILFISTESYGYILPYTPEVKEREHILDMISILRKMH